VKKWRKVKGKASELGDDCLLALRKMDASVSKNRLKQRRCNDVSAVSSMSLGRRQRKPSLNPNFNPNSNHVFISYLGSDSVRLLNIKSYFNSYLFTNPTTVCTASLIFLLLELLRRLALQVIACFLNVGRILFFNFFSICLRFAVCLLKNYNFLSLAFYPCRC